MIRIRIGQRWKREPTARGVDSVALELHGVDLLAGTAEEPVAEAVPALVGAVAALHAGEARLTEVPLAEGRLALVLRRDGHEVELQVARLARPARLLRPPVRVELEELARAARACAERFLPDAAALEAPRRRALARAVRVLGGEPSPWRARPAERWTREVGPHGATGFSLSLDDAGDVLRAYSAGAGPALGSLLCAGTVSWPGHPGWRAAGPPFLTALELSRQAAEVARALELGEARHTLELGGVRPGLALDLARGRARLGPAGAEFALAAEPLVRALYEAGLQLALGVTERARDQQDNPLLVELVERCQAGLAHLTPAAGVAPHAEPSEARAAPQRAAPERPLRPGARVRRLVFERAWEVRGLPGADRARLALQGERLVYAAAELACAFRARDGRQAWRRDGDHGVGLAPDGWVLAADARRVHAWAPRGAGARWLQDHDGPPLGPELLHARGLLLALSGGRTVRAFSTAVGREVWRLAPPRSLHGHLALMGSRALLATDAGYLYGLDVADGRVAFRLRAGLPFQGPVVPWGERFVALLGRGSHFALLAADALRGEEAWRADFHLSALSAPRVSGGRLYVCGERDGDGVLVCLDAGGRVRWERALHLGEGPWQLTALKGAVVAASPSGAAARVDANGTQRWRVGAAGAPLPQPLAPVAARGLVLVAGERVRAVDAASGEVVGECPAGPGLTALAAGPRLDLFLLDEVGALTAWRLATHLAVVDGRSD